MTTYPDDHVVFETPAGLKRYPLQDLELEWPPPPVLVDESGYYDGVLAWMKVFQSEISEEQRAHMTHVARWALYKPMEPTPDPLTGDGQAPDTEPTTAP